MREVFQAPCIPSQQDRVARMGTLTTTVTGTAQDRSDVILQEQLLEVEGIATTSRGGVEQRTPGRVKRHISPLPTALEVMIMIVVEQLLPTQALPDTVLLQVVMQIGIPEQDVQDRI